MSCSYPYNSPRHALTYNQLFSQSKESIPDECSRKKSKLI